MSTPATTGTHEFDRLPNVDYCATCFKINGLYIGAGHPIHRVSSGTPAEAKVCVQCEANARYNEAGGYAELAKQCREYCLAGHRDTPPAPEATGEAPPERIKIRWPHPLGAQSSWYYHDAATRGLTVEYIEKSAHQKEVDELRRQITALEAHVKDLNHDVQAAVDEANWQYRQGEDYGTY